MRKAHLAAASLAVLALSLPSGAIFADVGPSEDILADLEARLGELQAKGQGIVAAADEAGRDLEDAELADIEDNDKEIEKLTRQIAARKSALKAATPAGQGRRTAPAAGAQPAGSGGRSLAPRIDARHGFDNFGTFAVACRAAARNLSDHAGVQKLQAALTTYGNEGTGADGGYLVPPEFSREIWKKVEAEENLMNRCTVLTPSGNNMTIPKDETTPWGSSGCQAYWEVEAGQVTQSKGVFETSSLRLFKLMALCPVTDEQLEDAPGFESWLQAKVPGILAHKINTSIMRGTGAGQPLGILNSASRVTVSKETSQPADSVWFANINKMWGRMYAPWRRNAVWVVNQDVEPQLEGMAFVGNGITPTAASSTPVYLPPGGLADAPYGRLKGRPVIPLQAASTIGDEGDISLIDFNQYLVLKKASGIKTDTSIHLFFDQATTAFRFIFRMNGQPAWSSTITPENGTNTLSWAVTLQAR
jgi:HK97 family phage major capsid protein